MAIPLIWVAGAAAVAVAGYVGKKIYDKATESSSKSSSIPEVTIFLTGESGVGKDTIVNILKNGKFKKNHSPTSNLEEEFFCAYGKRLHVINTSGAADDDDENIEERRELEYGTRYVYVFRVDDYLTNPKVKKRVDFDLEVHKDICEKNSYIFKIIGTHKDKCLESGKSEEKIKTLANELGKKYGKCKILDLTKFNGKNKQKELCDFITD